jgi:dienelactone hydrolase
MATVDSAIALIPRKVLFGNPDRTSPSLSPCGTHLAYIAPHQEVLNIWLRSAGVASDRPLTRDTASGIRHFFWAHNATQIIYMQDQDGDENYRLYVIDIASNDVRCLTPPDPNVTHKVQANVQARSAGRPHEMIIGLNNRDQRCHDLYHVDLRTLELTLVRESWPQVQEWLVDNELQLRGCTEGLPDGGVAVKMYDGAAGAWSELFRWGAEDARLSRVAGFTPDNAGLYLIDSSGRDTAGLARYDLATGAREWLALDPQYDVSFVDVHPTRHSVQAAGVLRERMKWIALDPQERADFERLSTAQRGDFWISTRSHDNMHWLVRYVRDDGPLEYFTFDRHNGALTHLFSNREELRTAPLARMQPVQFTSRDGLTLHSYLTLPLDWRGPGPLVLNVHGGPWARDIWGLNHQAQWLANRGYACLQVNFRGSTGYGKAFTNAGDREWGRKMQDDLSDAVAWAIGQGIADPQRVAIFGGSYGGYAALAGVTFTPELYAGGVSGSGISNLETFLNTIPPYWERYRWRMDQRVGRIPRYEDGPRAGEPKAEADWSAEDRAEIESLRSRSPLFYVDQVRVPMLLTQGANDPRIKMAESDQFVAAMRARGLDVEYKIYANEGHGFLHPENLLDFHARAEAILARILGGRCEALAHLISASD